MGTTMTTDPGRESEQKKRSPLGWMARAGIAYLLLEVGALAGLLLLDKSLGVRFAPVSTQELPPAVHDKLDDLLRRNDTYLQHDPALGWSVRPGATTGRYRANAQGLRGERDYPLRTPPGVVRIATFGDSFTHGDDVKYGGTWQAQLEPTLTGAEVLNFGVPAYGVDQAYLRYMEDGKAFRPNVVLIGVMAENLFRGINVWRPYYKTSYEFPLTKPRFRVVEGELVLVPNPLANLKACEQLLEDPGSLLPGIASSDSLFGGQYTACAFDFFPSIRLGKMLNRRRLQDERSPLDHRGQYKTDHEAFEVLTGTLELFVKAARENQANVMVVLFPDNVLDPGSAETRPYAPLKGWLADQEIPFVDLQEGFDRHRGNLRKDQLTVGNYHHYSPAANGVVARTLQEELTQRGWVLP